ncbi:MAG: hypothetical protein AAB606_05015 [Patescibacteria group bacterium]
MKGKFITLYGINNIGKTTHAKRLVERLNKLGKKAVYIKYPIYDQNPTGPFLNDQLRRKKHQTIGENELQLWFVLNRYQFEPKLKKMLKEGRIVVAEDYTGTGIAWGTAKGANRRELENMNKFLVHEDFAVFMNGQRKMSSKESKHIHESNDALVHKCQAVFRNLARKYGWHTVKVAEDKEVTAARIWETVQRFL